MPIEVVYTLGSNFRKHQAIIRHALNQIRLCATVFVSTLVTVRSLLESLFFRIARR